MGKKELLAKEAKLKELESTVVGNFSINNGSLFRAAESLLAIKEGELFKAVKCDGKMAYRTFKAYLDHFELDATHRKLLEKLISFHECLIENKLEAAVPQLPNDDEFWTLFMKIKPEFWAKTVKSFGKRISKVKAEDVEAFIKLDPTCKVGYSASRKLPTPIQNILANAKKLDENAMNELVLRAGEDHNETFNRIFDLFAKVKESLSGCAVVTVDNKLIENDNHFAVERIGDRSKAIRYTRKKSDSANVAGFLFAMLVGGYIVGRAIEAIIGKIM